MDYPLPAGCKIYFGTCEYTNYITNNPLYGGKTTCTASPLPAGDNDIVMVCPDGVVGCGTGNGDPLNVVSL